MKTCIVIPTWENVPYLNMCLASLRMTRNAKFRVVVVNNGSSQTRDYLNWLQIKPLGYELSVINLDVNQGFIKGTNAGLRTAQGSGENVMWLNDDTQIVDPLWLARLQDNLVDNGAVGPTSNFVMGLQQAGFNHELPPRHQVEFLIGFCLLVRADAFRQVGLIDERFGMGGNDDLDYSLRLREAGYNLLVEREVFVLHYGAQSISRIGGYEKVEKETRPLLVEKWGQAKVDDLFILPDELKPEGENVHQSPG